MSGMDLTQAILGTAIIVLTFVDALQTTITVNGTGAIGRHLARSIWHLIRLPGSSRLHVLAGPIVVLTFVVVWFALLWGGWTLIFASSDTSVLQSSSRLPADTSGLLYFVGFSLITLGVGDYAPNGDLWQILTVVASASGFFIFTVIITYTVSVVSAVVEKRQLAAYIQSLGHSPQEILELGWTGHDYSGLDPHFVSLAQQIHRIQKQHLAYPVLHYFHSVERKASLGPAIVALDEALSVLMYVVPEQQRPRKAILNPVRDATTDLLRTLERIFIVAGDEAPPIPKLPQDLGEESVDAMERFEELHERRCLLRAWLEDEQWPWSEEAGDPAA